MKIKYTDALNKMSLFFAPALAVLGLVVGWQFLDYFNSTAKIDVGINHVITTYDQEKIFEDFIQYGVDIPDSILAIRMRMMTVRNVQVDRDYKSRRAVKFSLFSFDSVEGPKRFKNIREAVRDTFREIAGTAWDLPDGWTSNKVFWEEDFPALIEQVVDTITFHQALRIIISRRIVTVLMWIWNSGSAPAKTIEITLQRPWLLRPRSIMSQAEVEFMEIEATQPMCRITNYRDYAEISIPFLEENGDCRFYVTTSMQNVTKDNVFVDYTSEKNIDGRKIAYWSIGAFLFYYLIVVPLFGRLMAHPISGRINKK